MLTTHESRGTNHNSLLNNSLSDEDIINMNKAILKNNAWEEASDIWNFGKSIGISFKGEEKDIIRRLEALENRDKISFLNKNQPQAQGGEEKLNQ